MAETLPLFPLSTVLLPGASLPLHIFEPRYRQLVVDLVTGTVPGREFGVVAIRQGWEVGEDNVESLHQVGCSAVLVTATPLPDGRFDVLSRGSRRFRLLDIDDSSAPYLIGAVEWLADVDPPADRQETLPLLVEAARTAHRRYRELVREHRERPVDLPEDVAPGALAHLLAADCLLSESDRLQVLEENCPVRRLNLVRRLLNREAALLHALRAVPAPVSAFAELPSRN
ncbi:MAG TPA: LON peptidase substrate-binding domain-containing protein [Pseudonocardiaceae bacterium]